MPAKNPLHTLCALPGGPCNKLQNHTFLTLTFKPAYHAVPVKTLFYRTIPWIFKRLWRIAKEEWTLCPEITKDGVLHYHILIKTTQFVRLAAFMNCWKARYGGTYREDVFCIMGLLTYYFRKQNLEMAKLLRWPFRLCVMRGSIMPLLKRTLAKALLARNAIKQERILTKHPFDYLDNYYSLPLPPPINLSPKGCTSPSPTDVEL